GVTTQVDLSSSGVPADQPSHDPFLSADGRFVAFSSKALNLVPGKTQVREDIFWRDLQLGVTRHLSLGLLGAIANDQSLWPAISADGQVVTFTSDATNLVLGDTNGMADIFVYDMTTQRLTRASVSSAGEEGNAGSWFSAISGDGRFVAFSSWASNLAANDTNGDWDVFVHDRSTGQTTLISRDLAGGTSIGPSWIDDISRDGRFVSFESMSANLVPGDTNGVWDAFLHDRTLGTTVRISVDPQGKQLVRESYGGPLSADGAWMLITSLSGSLVPGDTNGAYDAFRVEVTTGVMERISVDSSGAQSVYSGGAFAADLSSDGRIATFTGASFTLPPQTSGVFVRACPQSTARFGEAKPNSAGCRPWISWSGIPSATAGSGFVIRSQAQLNQKPGLFFYGYAPHPFGPIIPYLSVLPPLRRLPPSQSGGSSSGTDCTGGFRVDFNAWIAGGSDPGLVAGTTVYGQFWSRDPGYPAPGNYSLTDAVDLTIQP
ncbi:MAG TPA: hypothetical protein VFX15_14880, partial [Actinomycetes bacterium]|nr:hypothetical protein [Actinomycetes bacterium]